MVHSGEGATGPDADASRIAWEFSGGLTAPRILVFLLRTRQSHGAMKAPCHIPALASRAAFSSESESWEKRTYDSAHPLFTSHCWLPAPAPPQRAPCRPRRSVVPAWQVQLLVPTCFINSSRAATP